MIIQIKIQKYKKKKIFQIVNYIALVEDIIFQNIAEIVKNLFV